MKNFNKILIIALGLVIVLTLSSLVRAATVVDLGTADNFAVLAGSGITDSNPSNITGDVGLSPTTGAAIGIPAGEVTGTIYAVNAAGPLGAVEDPALLTLAKNDLTTAYNDAGGQPTSLTIPTELGGSTQIAGVYDSADGTFGLTGTLTLDAEGDPNAVFIFKTTSTFITAGSSNIILNNEAQACNVFWQVGSSATLGTDSDLKGNILAEESITDNGGSTIEGRLLASVGAVTLNNTTVDIATCAIVVPPVATTTLEVIKVVINDNSGTKTISDFPLFIDGFSVTSSVASSTTAGLHTVSETADSGYASVISGDCASDGTITLIAGDEKTCTVTNDDIAPTTSSSGGSRRSRRVTPVVLADVATTTDITLPPLVSSFVVNTNFTPPIVPKLPNAGLPPRSDNFLWSAMALASIFTTLTFLYFPTKKQPV